jgi:hypothetical protein
MNPIYEVETVSATAKIINYERRFTWMSLAIVAIDKVGGRCWLAYLKHDS